MSFRDIQGNEKLIERLSAAVKNDFISHAYIFEGEACLDKRAFADAFIQSVLCTAKPGEGCDECIVCTKIHHGNHEDISYVEAEGTSIKDEAIERMQERLKTKPYGSRNIAVICDADTMTLRAQNRLLKTLEEPPAGTILILLSENIENLTQTILSRCVKYRINYFGSPDYEYMIKTAEEAADLLLEGAPFYRLKQAIAPVAKENKETAAFLDALEKVYRDLLLGKGANSKLYKREQIYRNVAVIEETRRQIHRGVSNGYALKNLLIKIGG